MEIQLKKQCHRLMMQPCSNAPKQAWRRQENKQHFRLIAGNTNIVLSQRILSLFVCYKQETRRQYLKQQQLYFNKAHSKAVRK